MQNNKKQQSSSAYPSPAATAKAANKAATSPVFTPGGVTEVGEGATAYSQRTEDNEPAPSEFEDLEGRGYLRRDESENEPSTSAGPDVEMRSVAEIEAEEAKKARNRRLTLQQLDRFRRAIAVNKARHARRTSSSQWELKVRRGEGFDSVFAENPEGMVAPDALRELRIVSYPWSMWVLGALLIIAASVFVDNIHKKALAKKRLPISEDSVNWWKYLVAGIIYVCAALVIANGRVETFIMDKERSTLSIRSTKPLCVLHKLRRTRVVERELRQILDVRVETSGEILSGEVDTRAYKVHFDFDDGTHATTLEGRSKKKAVFRCRLIKQFLLSCAPAYDTSPVSGSGSTSGSDAVGSPTAAVVPTGRTESVSMNNSIVLPARSASSNLTLAVPAPASMPVAQSPGRIMMVAAVPSSLSQTSVVKPQTK